MVKKTFVECLVVVSGVNKTYNIVCFAVAAAHDDDDHDDDDNKDNDEDDNDDADKD